MLSDKLPPQHKTKFKKIKAEPVVYSGQDTFFAIEYRKDGIKFHARILAADQAAAKARLMRHIGTVDVISVEKE